MDSLMVLLAVILSAAWPIGYSLQELAKKKDNSEHAAP